MKEYSANISDSLRHKIKAFALKQSKMEQQRTRSFQDDAAKAVLKAKRNQTLSQARRKELMTDALRTTNNCTLQDIMKCKDREELRNLIIRTQPNHYQKIEAGGVLNCLHQAYRFISLEEESKAANKQKLTAVEKNKLALMYMEMRQDADIRNSLCDKFKVDVEAVRNKKSKSQVKADKTVKELEDVMKKAKPS